ncbi:MAG: zinc ribbon domain-containing protein [Lachnospiraceae bacterium]|nr:zinc ribbon domain-containing protein [Lachnospiraceae bacterium]
MFCNKCGKQLPDDSQFCTFCGNNLMAGNNSVMSYTDGSVDSFNQARPVLSTENDRRSSIEELERSIKYFHQNLALYDEYDMLNLREIPKMVKKTRFKYAGIFIIMALWFLLSCFVLCTFGITGVAQVGIAHQQSIAPKLTLILLVVVLLGSIAATVLYIVLMLQANKAAKVQLQVLEQKADNIAEELAAYYRAYGYCVVGIEYSNPRILKRLYDMICAGRADTPKEAINTLIQDKHNAIMRYHAEQTSRNTKSAAIAAWFIAAELLL